MLIFVINLFIFNKIKNIENRIYFYFFLIPITYLLGFVNLFMDTAHEKNIEFFYYLTFILQMFNALLILNNFSKIVGTDEAILLKINLLIIFIYTIIMYDFYNLGFNYHLNYLNTKIITNQNGLCRILNILSCFITCHYIIKKQKVTHLLLIIILNFLIINIESRQGLALIIIQLLVTIFLCYQKNEIIKKIFQYLFILIVIPLSLSFFVKDNLSKNRLFLFQGDFIKFNTIKPKLEEDLTKKSKLEEDLTKKSKLEEYLKDNQLKQTLKSINLILTGRLDKWHKASTHIMNSKIKNILFGNGPQFDRKIEARGEDVASGILYAFLCGGLLGLLVFFLIIKKILKIISYTFYNKKKIKTDVYYCLSICCIISLALRIFIENGFLIYGVDFLLITSSIFYVTKKLKTI